ncbi:hypothetical protein [Stutzerimonas nitrititolerans]|uniref:hypothetical protein n=1 Tax=Stutzerimonas nitrititolerans TaxID=2482751 RepID=UPI0028A8D5AE|nr:hypothetical protein [Stutzerimonas nitrititolerans]
MKLSKIIHSVVADAASGLNSSLNHFYPAWGRNGFNERNLTYQMAKSFEKRKASCAFMEIPFFDSNREVYGKHVDALMFDRYVALFVESKRLYSPDKLEQLRLDYERMTVENLGPVLESLCLRPSAARKSYRVILAETWSTAVSDWWEGKDSPRSWSRAWMPPDTGVIPVRTWKDSGATLYWLYAFSPLP